MKRTIIFYLFYFISFTTYSQNLVANYSFEQYDTCPSITTQICFAVPWFQPAKKNNSVCYNASSTDYFNSCCISPFQVCVPKNVFGFQYANTGLAYSGFTGYDQTPNYREYLEGVLNDSLTHGKKYCASFYISLANGSTCGIDSIGIYFSRDSVLYNTYQDLSSYGYNPQVLLGSPNNNFLTDTLNWMYVSSEYIAQGGEKFITIGNFSPNNMTNIDTIANGSLIAYYYIDDVSVYLCDTVESDTTFYVPNAFSPNGDGMNDSFFVQGNLDELHCSIFNRWGEQVAELTLPKQGWDGRVNGLPCNDGVYFYYLTAKDKSGKEITKKGNVTLLR